MGPPVILGMELLQKSEGIFSEQIPGEFSGGVFGGFFAFRRAFQPEFGAYRALARVLKSPLNHCKTAEGEKSWKRALSFSAPNSGMHQTLVRKRSEPCPWEKQDEKIHPKIHSKIQIRIWELCGQNPHWP